MPEVINIPDETTYSGDIIIQTGTSVSYGMYGQLMWSGSSAPIYRYFFSSMYEPLEYECCDEKIP